MVLEIAEGRSKPPSLEVLPPPYSVLSPCLRTTAEAVRLSSLSPVPGLIKSRKS